MIKIKKRLLEIDQTFVDDAQALQDNFLLLFFNRDISFGGSVKFREL